MEKTQKIGKNARDIFAPTSPDSNQETPAAVAKATRLEPSTAVATPPGADGTSSECVTAPAGRGRPPLHQEPVSKITTVLLNRHVVYLDGISNEIRQGSGAVVKRSEILRALVEALEAAQPDLDQVRSQADLTELLRVRLQ